MIQPRHYDALRRALRTFLQAFLASCLMLVATGAFTITTPEGAILPNYSVLDDLFVASLFSGIVALASFFWNALEQKTGSSGFLISK